MQMDMEGDGLLPCTEVEGVTAPPRMSQEVHPQYVKTDTQTYNTPTKNY